MLPQKQRLTRSSPVQPEVTNHASEIAGCKNANQDSFKKNANLKDRSAPQGVALTPNSMTGAGSLLGQWQGTMSSL